MNRLWYLSQISIFEELSPEEIREIDQLNTVHHFKQLPPNTVFQTPETAKEGLFFLKEGKLRLYKLNDNGKQLTLGILSRGNMFGELESFSFGTRQVYVETVDASFICSMSESQFERLMVSRPKLALKFLKALSERLKERDDQLEQMAFYDLRGRVLHLLAALGGKFGILQGSYVQIDLPLTHQEIANMLSSSREAVSAVLSELTREGYIKTGRMSIQLDAARFKASGMT